MIYRFDKNGRRTPYQHRPWVLWLLLAAVVAVSVGWSGPVPLVFLAVLVGVIVAGMWLSGCFESDR